MTGPALIMNHDPCIGLNDGHEISLVEPEIDAYRVGDIAKALGKLCRYTGQCNRFYSVAEHSVIVSHLVPPEYAMHGLLHDAQEAILGDQSAPLKHYLSAVPFDNAAMIEGLCRLVDASPSDAVKVEMAAHIRRQVVTFSTIETRFEDAVARAFDLDWTQAAVAAVKLADMTALVTEARQLFVALGPSWRWILERYRPSKRVAVQCWDEDTAARRFMDRFNEISRGRN